jgi:hypothetical protein
MEEQMIQMMKIVEIISEFEWKLENMWINGINEFTTVISSAKQQHKSRGVKWQPEKQ